MVMAVQAAKSCLSDVSHGMDGHDQPSGTTPNKDVTLG
jgi:hypothetical protein